MKYYAAARDDLARKDDREPTLADKRGRDVIVVRVGPARVNRSKTRGAAKAVTSSRHGAIK